MPHPVQVLSYTESVSARRPGVVTAIGVLSIIFGAMGLIGTAFGTLMYLGFLMTMSAVATMGTSMTADIAGPHGYDAAQRDVIIQAFNSKRPMSGPVEAQFTFLLSDVGQKIVPGIPSNTTSADPVKDYVALNLTGESGWGVEGGIWYDVPSGRITLTNTDATFTPNPDSSLPTFKRTTQRRGASSGSLSTLSEEEIQAVIDRVQDLAGSTPLNTTQVKALHTNLSTNAVGFIGPQPDMPSLLSQVSMVIPNNSSHIIRFNTSTLTISPTGGTAVTPSVNMASPFPKMRKWPLTLAITSSLVSLLLCVYLIVAGIETLRNKLYAARLHRIYAWIKIMLTIVGSLASGWVWADFSRGIINASPSPSAGMNNSWAAFSTGMTVGMLVLGLAYPVALLIALRTRTAREFYSPVIDPARTTF